VLVLANAGYKLITRPLRWLPVPPSRCWNYLTTPPTLTRHFPYGTVITARWSLKQHLYNLLNDPAVGGGRKILATKTGTAIFGGISPTNVAAGYVIRTAELFLIRAEARAKKATPDLTGALADLNAVRVRSGIAASTAATVDDILLAVENERRVEFALEPQRWFDLVRTGRAPAVLSLSDANKYIFPIPGAEILANPALVQNPGY
jgi:hypothetical protein